MSVIHIQGMQSLNGTILIQGSKNAVLPVMAASLLHRGVTVLTNVPGIQDVFCMMGILESMGCCCRLDGRCLTIDASRADRPRVPEGLAGQMRSSVMLLGPMLGRFGEGATSHPGGCLIGSRPIDLHLSGLEALGAKVELAGGTVRVEAGPGGLTGREIALGYPSVGATENIVMAAAAARGTTVLIGAAREPEIETLCRFLQAAGAEIRGIGTGCLRITGCARFRDTVFAIPGDRIVAGTYLGAVMAAGGSVFLKGAPAGHMEANLRLAREMGARIRIREDGSGIDAAMDGRAKAASFSTGPYPGFPTDLQSVMMAVAAAGVGRSRIQETVFENRFSTAKELQNLGAHIIIDGRTALVDGRSPLRGGKVRAADLRGGAALVVAGLAAAGEVEVSGCGHIRRGYEDICRDLKEAGARIWMEEGAACEGRGGQR